MSGKKWYETRTQASETCGHSGSQVKVLVSIEKLKWFDLFIFVSDKVTFYPGSSIAELTKVRIFVPVKALGIDLDQHRLSRRNVKVQHLGSKF